MLTARLPCVTTRMRLVCDHGFNAGDNTAQIDLIARPYALNMRYALDCDESAWRSPRMTKYDLIPRSQQEVEDGGILLPHKLLHKFLLLFFYQILTALDQPVQGGVDDLEGFCTSPLPGDYSTKKRNVPVRHKMLCCGTQLHASLCTQPAPTGLPHHAAPNAFQRLDCICSLNL